MLKALNQLRALTNYADAIIASAWVAAALFIFAIAAAICYAGGISAPFLDLWRYTNPDHYMAHLFERHNGHPLLINRLALALDYEVFDGGGDAVRIGTLFVKAGEAAALFVLARLAGVRSRRDQIMCAAAAIAIAFCAAPHINLRQQFQFSFVLAFAGTVAAVAALATYAATKQLWSFVLACLLSAIAAQSLLNGLLAPVLLLALAVLYKLPLTHIAALVGVFVVSLVSILLNPAPSPGLPPLGFALIWNTLEIIGGAPGSLLHFATQEFGVELAAPERLSLVLGALMALASAPTLWRVVRGRASQAEIAAMGLIAFGAMSAGMMALGRSWVSGNDSVVSRYTETSIVVMGGLFVIATAAALKLTPALQRVTFVIALPFALIFAVGGIGALKLDQSVQRARLTAQTAQIVGITDTAATSALGGRGVARRYFQTASEDLKAHGKMHYADRWARRLGETISEEPQRTCISALTLRSAPYDGFIRIQGDISSRESHAARAIVLLDQTRRMVGYGRVVRRWDDGLALIFDRPPREATGFAHAIDPLNYTAYLANQDGLQCRLNYRLGRSLRNR